MYDYLEQEKLLPEDQKGCRRRSNGTRDQLFIDKTVAILQEEAHQFIYGFDRLQESI